MADTTTTAQEALLQNVLATFQNTPNARMKEVVEATIRHMHALIDEVKLTQDEWMAGIQFLTAIGKFTSDQRHEMILLSDVVGVSSLVEMLNYKGMSGATENTVLGPFYIPGSKQRANGDSIIETDDPGDRVRLSGRVLSQDGAPIQGATLDIWETASNGFYPVQDPSQDPMNLRAILTTDANGYYEFLDDPSGALPGARRRPGRRHDARHRTPPHARRPRSLHRARGRVLSRSDAHF